MAFRNHAEKILFLQADHFAPTSVIPQGFRHRSPVGQARKDHSFRALRRAVVCESIPVTLGARRGRLEDAVWSLVREKLLDARVACLGGTLEITQC